MINANFKLGGEIVIIKVEGNSLGFFDVGTGQFTTLDGLRLSKAGVLKEFPDLKNDADWRIKSINRLKKHLKSIEKEMDKMIYVKNELIKFGYEPLSYTKAGFRPQKFK